MSKYHAEPTEYDGHTYASKAEAIRAQELDLLLRGGAIRRWRRQPRFELGLPECVYVADFIVENDDGTTHVEDVKGFETPKFKRDKILWRKYGKYQLVIMRRTNSGWSKTIIQPGEQTT